MGLISKIDIFDEIISLSLCKDYVNIIRYSLFVIAHAKRAS